ncbi:hypothetical protein V6N12_047055 [Hibiscus sabdariffa]|uniref:Uncharacterized protein n=1 Tax=Hibiscus sabdariffa TaxID=183260 RepID=A0ABR1ZHH2_9ROSI
MHASISVDQEQPPLPPEPANVEDQVASDLDSAQPLRTELILVASPSLPVLPSSTRPSKTVKMPQKYKDYQVLLMLHRRGFLTVDSCRSC